MRVKSLPSVELYNLSMKEPSAISGELINEAFERRKEEEAEHNHAITFRFKAIWSLMSRMANPK
jgi:hypothetical protein